MSVAGSDQILYCELMSEVYISAVVVLQEKLQLSDPVALEISQARRSKNESGGAEPYIPYIYIPYIPLMIEKNHLAKKWRG